MDTRKHIVDLEAFREILHISPRVPSQSFAELPFEEEILEFLRFLRHSAQIKTLTDSQVISSANFMGAISQRNVDYAFLIWEDLVYQVEHKNQKKSNEMYYPRFTKVIIHYFMMKKPSIPRRNKVNWHYVRDDILFSTIKVHQKPKASARRKRGGSASSTTPPTPIATPTPITTVVATPRLSAAAKGKQPARATSPTDPSDVERTEAELLKIILRRSKHETHISQQGGSSTDEGTGEKTDESDDDDDDQDKAEKVNDDDDNEEEISKIDDQEATESGEGDDEETESDRESEEEETREKEEESFDLIPRTPEDNEDDVNGEEDQGVRISEEERMQEEEEADELYRDVNINQGMGLQVSQDIEDSHVTLTLTHSDGQQESSSTSSFVTNLLNLIIDPGMESIFTTGSSFITPIPSPKSTMKPSIMTTTTTASQPPIPPTPIPSEFLQNLPTLASVFCFEDRVKSLEVNFLEFMRTHTDLSEIELKKILIDKMEGNKSIQRSDEQRNLYKALVDAYEAD
nr:hypothetical protein [Tanacetum cinerariifolium]